MNSKLGFSSAYNRPRNLSPISPTPNKIISDSDGQNRSAVVTKLNKTIKHLGEENKTLKAEIVELRDSVKQIFTESRHEKYDERRINMIKFQIIQLERQISILTEALGSRSEAVLEVENTMSVMADKLRSFISADVKGQMVPIARSDLIALVESSESARIKLFKSIEKNTPEELGKELLYLNPCLRRDGGGRREEPLTLLDINLKRLEYINLRHVSQMESKLSLLYKELVRMHNQVETMQAKDSSHCRLLNGQAATSEEERIKTSLLKTGVMIKDCADDLLALSLLCPSAPWPVLKRPVMKDIPLDRITAALPPLAPQKLEEISHVLQACLGTLNHRIHLLHKDKSVLEEELAFHRAVYDTQMKYTHVVFDAVREGCKEFEDSARTLLCAPLKSILEAYNLLERTKSKGALKEILLVLKANESQISSIIDMFEDPGTENNINRSEALSTFSTEFMQHVNSLVVSCQRKRDEAILEKKEVKDGLRTSSMELQQCIEELEAKYERQWVPKRDKMDSIGSRTTPSSTIHHHHPDSTPTNTNLSNSKEFIHAQLFGDLDVDNRDSSRSDSDKNSSRKEESKKLCSNNKRPDVIGGENENTAVLKLRSFLDDGEGLENNIKSGIDLNPNSKKSHREKWVSDFSSERTIQSSREIENNDYDHHHSVPSHRKSKKHWRPDTEWVDDFSSERTVPSKDLENNDHVASQRKPNKHWRPETEWVNDFSAKDSDLLDQMEGMDLNSKESSQSSLARNGRVSCQNMPKELESEEAIKSLSKSNHKAKGSKKVYNYEVDLRVANQKLKLKRPETDSNDNVNRKKS